MTSVRTRRHSADRKPVAPDRVDSDPPSGGSSRQLEDWPADEPASNIDEAATDAAAETGDVAVAEGKKSHGQSVAVVSSRRRRFSWRGLLVHGVLPGLALTLTLASGYLKWQGESAHHTRAAAVDSVQAATEGTVLMLTYHPDTVDKELSAARDRLTGTFRDAYAGLINDVVIPGAKQKGISAVATVPAAASVSATENHAVVLVFVNQTTVIGNDRPTDNRSSVRVTLDKVENHWLISQFEPL